MFSLHRGKKPKKGKQSRDGTHFRQTGNRDDYLSSEDEEGSEKLISFASSHPGDSDQPHYHYPGQQCAGSAFISLLYSNILLVASWTKGTDSTFSVSVAWDARLNQPKSCMLTSYQSN